MSGRPTRVTLAGAVVLALVACTSSGGGEAEPTEPPSAQTPPAPEQGRVQQPADGVTVLPGADGALALEASRTFFASAPVVVLADDADPAAHLRAGSLAVALGAPVLLDDDGAALGAELTRLGSGWVVTVGDVTLPDAVAPAEDGAEGGEVVAVPAPADDGAAADLLGVPVDEPVAAEAGEEVASVAGLERGRLTPLVGTTDDASTPDAPDDAAAQPPEDAATRGGPGAAAGDAATAEPSPGGTLPVVDPSADPAGGRVPALDLPDPVSGTLVLTTGAPAELPAVATARAAGADLALVPGGDPRATSRSVAALAEAQPAHVVGLGDGFGDAETLGWRAATAATGVELPGGGQLVLPGKRYVALYGTPGTAALGVLGEQGVAETVERAAEHARPYEALTEDAVVPALEIIATVASAGAGDDGNYSNELPVERLRPLVEAAGEAGQYVVLDLQPGRASFLEQAQRYAELLALAHVGLALDPEWNLGPQDRHLVRIGSVTAAEVNEVVDWLADLTREHNLPQKLLVLHQFQVRMIQTVPEVDLSRSELAVLVHADGQGPQGSKQETWRTLHANAPDIDWWGWKNFYDEDSPMLTPEETARVEPFPHFISYQ